MEQKPLKKAIFLEILNDHGQPWNHIVVVDHEEHGGLNSLIRWTLSTSHASGCAHKYP